MTDRPRHVDRQDHRTEDLAPENMNSEQGDEAHQAQTFSVQTLGHGSDDFDLEERNKVLSAGDSDDDDEGLYREDADED